MYSGVQMPRKVLTHDRNGRKIPPKPSQDLEFRGFFDQIEDKEAFLQACESSDNERLHIYAQLRREPRYKAYLDVTLCKDAGVTLKNVLECYTGHQKTLAMARMAERMPQVACDIAQDAETRRMPCPKCHGVGKISVEGEELSCEACWGTGEKRESGDPKAREQMLEALEITGKKGPLVAQQFNIDGGFSVDALIKQGQKVLEGR